MPVVKSGVRSLSKSGSTQLKGDVTLTQGTNVTLTQSGQDITIAASGSGSGDMTKAVYDTNSDNLIDVAAGGTGAGTASGARTNLGAVNVAGDTMTGRLKLAAGTASAGTEPLQLQSGTNLTTPEAGAVEYDGTSLFFTPASTRLTIANTGTVATKVVAPSGSTAMADYYCDGTADDVQIQAALDAVSSLGGGKVLLKMGTYSITAILSIASNVFLVGEGWSTNIQVTNSTNLSAAIQFAANSSNNGVMDLQIDGNKANQTAGGALVWSAIVTNAKVHNLYVHDSYKEAIYLSGATNCIVSNCYTFNNTNYGYGLEESGSTVSSGNKIVNCTSDGDGTGGAGGGFSIYYALTTRSYGNSIVNCTAKNITTSGSIGVSIWETYRNVVLGCYIYNCALGLQINSGYDNQILGNKILNTSNSYGVYIYQTSGQPLTINNFIANNLIYSTVNAGISIASGVSNIIIGNVISYAGAQGMIVGSGCNYNILNNNKITYSTSEGLKVYSNNNSISGNVTNNNSIGTLGTNAGIFLTSTASNNTLTGNIALDTQTSDTSSLTSNASSGQKVVIVSNAYLFNVNEYVTISDSTPQSENNQIASIDSATQITMTTNLTNTYTTANSAVVTGRASQKYGIHENNSSNDYNTYIGNIASGNITNQISTSGTHDILDNNQGNTTNQWTDGQNLSLGTTTGTKIGTATSQKIAFYNSTPIVQPGATTDLGTVLSNLGLRASGTAYPITTSGVVSLTGGVTISTTALTITDVNLILGTTTGTKIGTGTTQKLGFYNATPIVQPANTVAIDDLLVNLGLRASGGVANFTAGVSFGKTAYFGAEHDYGSSGSSLTIDFSTYQHVKVTLSAACTFTFTAPSGPTIVTIKFVNGGAFTPTWPTIKWAGGAQPTWTASGTDIISLYYDGTNYYGAANTNFA